MKLNINQSDEYTDVEITICCNTVDQSLERLIGQIRLYGFALHGKKDGKTTLVLPEDIYYFESIDGKTFLYKEKDVYECDLKLYEVEERFCKGFFLRISKANILNIKKLQSFRTQFNGKLEAYLLNGERLEVNRHYVPELKKRLLEMEGRNETD